MAVKVLSEKIVLGSDSIRTSGWTQEKDKLAKLFQVNGLTVGSCGNCRESGLFHLFCNTHKPSSATELSLTHFFSEFLAWYRIQVGNTAQNLENVYLVVFERAVYYFDNFYVRQVRDHFAIGAGRDFALAALYMGNMVDDAVKIACELSVLCEEPVNLIEIPLTDSTK